jgi:hypothetical protein
MAFRLSTLSSFLRNKTPVFNGLLLIAGVAMLGFIGILIRHPDGIRKADRKTFPWQVYVEADRECGGVFVKPDWVLTAAHCVHADKESGSTVFVYTGLRQGSGPIYESVGEIRIPRQYVHSDDETVLLDYDIALVQVEARGGGHKAGIVLGDLNDELVAANNPIFVAGWHCGSKLIEAFWLDLVFDCGQAKVYTDLRLRSQEKCDELDDQTSNFFLGGNNNNFICAGGSDAEQLPGIDLGDSGSGLTTDKTGCAKLLGTVNYAGSPAGDAYARIAHHAAWIKSIIGEQTVRLEADGTCSVT